MHQAHRYISSLLLAFALAAPVAVLGAPGPQASVQVRVYDSHHKDYHNWDDRENHSWELYLSSNHRRDHDFSRASKREQTHYWNWRHAHPDHD